MSEPNQQKSLETESESFLENEQLNENKSISKQQEEEESKYQNNNENELNTSFSKTEEMEESKIELVQEIDQSFLNFAHQNFIDNIIQQIQQAQNLVQAKEIISQNCSLFEDQLYNKIHSDHATQITKLEKENIILKKAFLKQNQQLQDQQKEMTEKSNFLQFYNAQIKQLQKKNYELSLILRGTNSCTTLINTDHYNDIC